MKAKKVLLGGIVNNPVFVLVLGMCPTLSMSTTLSNSLWLGLCTALVLVFSNLSISLLRKVIPDGVRIPCYIVIIATLVTLVDMLLAKFLPDVHQNIGKFIGLIVVNCIILARAEAFANNNPPLLSALDGASMGLGFTISICLLGTIREILAQGKIWGIRILPREYTIALFGKTPGAFILLAILMGIFNFVYKICVDKHQAKLIKQANATEVE